MRLFFWARLCRSLPAGFTPYVLTKRRFCIYASFTPFSKPSFAIATLVCQSRPVLENLQINHIKPTDITMRLNRSFAALAMLFAAFVPGLFAGPVESSSKALVDRDSAITQPQGSCVNPSQIDLSQPRSVGGSCNWREWTLCVALATGACFIPCDLGG